MSRSLSTAQRLDWSFWGSGGRGDSSHGVGCHSASSPPRLPPLQVILAAVSRIMVSFIWRSVLPGVPPPRSGVSEPEPQLSKVRGPSPQDAQPRRPRPRPGLCCPSRAAACSGHTGARQGWRRRVWTGLSGSLPCPFCCLGPSSPGSALSAPGLLLEEARRQERLGVGVSSHLEPSPDACCAPGSGAMLLDGAGRGRASQPGRQKGRLGSLESLGSSS